MKKLKHYPAPSRRYWFYIWLTGTHVIFADYAYYCNWEECDPENVKSIKRIACYRSRTKACTLGEAVSALLNKPLLIITHHGVKREIYYPDKTPCFDRAYRRIIYP